MFAVKHEGTCQVIRTLSAQRFICEVGHRRETHLHYEGGASLSGWGLQTVPGFLGLEMVVTDA